MARPRTLIPNLGTGPGATLARRLAHNLSTTRSAKGLSQEKLAALSGSTLSTISCIERAQRKINLDTLADLAEALQVPPAALIS